MKAQLVIYYIVELKGINLNTLTDIDFTKFSWLNKREEIPNMKGEKVSKSYYYQNKKEAIRIVYEKIFGDFEYNSIVYPDIYLGNREIIYWVDWAGELCENTKKIMQPEYFNLEPVFLGDGTETIVGFSSPLMRRCLKNERISADDYLQAKNPQLYVLLYDRYGNEYNGYLQTGVKTSFVNALNAESDPTILAALNNEVFGYESMTVKELIILNLQ